MLHRLIIYIAGCGCNLNSGYDGSVKQRLIGIQWSWIRIPLQHTFYSYFQTTFSGGKLYIFVRSLTTSNLAKLSTLLRAPWWHQFFSPRWPEPYWWVLGRTKHVPADIHAEFICWALWRTLMRTNFMFVHSPEEIWQSSAPYLEHSGDIGYSLLVEPRHTDESWEGHIYIYIYIYIYLYKTG